VVNAGTVIPGDAGGDLGSVIQILNFLPEDQLHALLL